MMLKTGDKVKFREEKQRYIVRTANDRFAVCTKPFNAKKTTLYTVVDFEENIRGTENLIFCAGAETDEDCQEMLERLASGETAVSHRRNICLDIENVNNEMIPSGVRGEK